jgi:hypothetical protein
MSEQELDEKIKVYNFEALKGSIVAHPVFKGAVSTFKKFASSQPKTFSAISDTFQEQAEMKREEMGILDMTPEELLDSILEDIDRLPPEKRQKYLDSLAGARERKRMIENALLQLVMQQSGAKPPPSGEIKAMMQSGKISDNELKDIGATVKAAQTDFQKAYDDAMQSLREGMKEMETKRTIQ